MKMSLLYTIQSTYFLFNFLIWILTHLCLWTHDLLWAPMMAWAKSEDVTVKAKIVKTQMGPFLGGHAGQKKVTGYDTCSQQGMGEYKLTKWISGMFLCLFCSQRKWITTLVLPDVQYAPGSSSAQWSGGPGMGFRQTISCRSMPCLWVVNVSSVIVNVS